MLSGAISQLREAVDALADEELPTLLGDELVELHQLHSRLAAQISRRVRAFDRSKEWQQAGARTPGAWLQHRCRLAGREARAAVSVRRRVEQMPVVAQAWRAGAISTSTGGTTTGPPTSPTASPCAGTTITRRMSSAGTSNATTTGTVTWNRPETTPAGETHPRAKPPPVRIENTAPVAPRLRRLVD